MASRFEGLGVADYLSRKPERLLLEALRQCNGGYETGCMSCWDRAADSFTAELGLRAAAEPLLMIAQMVRLLRQRGDRLPQFYPENCRRMCRDECCLMAMVAAAQGQDRFCFDMAADTLGQKDSADSLHSIVSALADAMAQNGLTLLPVPATVLAPIVGKSLAVS